MKYNSMIKKWTIGAKDDEADRDLSEGIGDLASLAEKPNEVYGELFVQLMVLLTAGETESCKWNAKQVFKQMHDR
jgi:hypothetical protein